MHRGAIAPHWIITAWIGIPRSGGFLLPSCPQPCRGRPRPLRRARARRPARPGARAWARRIALFKTVGEEASLLPSQNVSSPPKTGGEEGLCFRRCVLYRNIQNGRGGGVSPPLPKRLLPSQNGRGGGPLFSQVRVVPEHTIGGDPGVGAGLVVRWAPGQRAARDGYSRPWAPD